MRSVLALLILLVVALPAGAAQITITVPDAAVPRLQALCAEIQSRFRVIDANWSNQHCAEWLVLNGALDVEEKVSRRAAQTFVRDAVSTAVDDFKGDFPEPFVRSYCGDGNTDLQYDETCDDGNVVSGDGCSASCTVEP